MNRENIQRVRDAISGADPRKFNMGIWLGPYRADPGGRGVVDVYFVESGEKQHTDPECGTAACIAGWATAMRRQDEKKKLDFDLSPAHAQEWFGLDNGEAYKLFYGQGITGARANRLSEISQEEGVAVLDILLETGKVDWQEALDRVQKAVGQRRLDADLLARTAVASETLSATSLPEPVTAQTAPSLPVKNRN